MNTVCCQKISGLQNQKSPFQKIIAFGYYDGPTAGAAQCAECLESYKYDLLAWDENQDIRVYSFAPLPSQSFQQIVKECSVLGEPRWPIWCPTWEFDLKETEERVEAEIKRILSRAGQVEFVLASENLAGDILSLKRLTDKDQSKFQNFASAKDQNNIQDWLAFLGL
jgi:hypothetical protein